VIWADIRQKTEKSRNSDVFSVRMNLQVSKKNEIEIIESLNIKTSIDLRGNELSEKEQSYFQNKNGVQYHQVPINTDDMHNVKDQNLGNFYWELMQNKELFCHIMQIIAHSSGNVHFNCLAGKDRTGIVAMILLANCDVSNDDILADYEITFTYLYEKWKKLIKSHTEIPLFMFKSDREFISKTIDLVNENCGNIHEYLKFIGLSENEIMMLKNKLL